MCFSFSNQYQVRVLGAHQLCGDMGGQMPTSILMLYFLQTSTKLSAAQKVEKLLMDSRIICISSI